MFKLSYVKPEDATGVAAEVYGLFPKEIPVPEPLQMVSASPGLLGVQKHIMKYYMGHETLSSPLMACLRLFAAQEACFGFCRTFNDSLLQQMGMTGEEIAAMLEDPRQAPLEENEVQMLDFVVKCFEDSGHATEERLESLRGLGWTDADIYDALTMYNNMLAVGRMDDILRK